MKKILIVLTTALLLAACSNDNDPAATNDGSRVPLQVTGYIADFHLGVTRAAGSEWEDGDSIGIYAVNTGTTPENLQSDQHAPFRLRNGGTGKTDNSNGTYNYKVFFSNSPVYLPEDENNYIDVYGYYPYNATYINPAKIPVDVSTQTKQKSIDLMTTGIVSSTTINGDTRINKLNPSCQLLFHHRLTKLVFNLKPGEDFTNKDIEGATSLTISNQRTEGIYNIYIKKLICVGEANKTITAVAVEKTTDGYDKTFEAIVLPNDATNPAVDRKVTIVVQGKSCTFTIAKPSDSNSDTDGKIKVYNTYEAGKKYVYNVTVYPFAVVVDSDKYTEQW